MRLAFGEALDSKTWGSPHFSYNSQSEEAKEEKEWGCKGRYLPV